MQLQVSTYIQRNLYVYTCTYIRDTRIRIAVVLDFSRSTCRIPSSFIGIGNLAPSRARMGACHSWIFMQHLSRFPILWCTTYFGVFAPLHASHDLRPIVTHHSLRRPYLHQRRPHLLAPLRPLPHQPHPPHCDHPRSSPSFLP